MGLTLHAEADGGGASFRVWAPHARPAALEVRGGGVLPLARSGDTWAARFEPGAAPRQRRRGGNPTRFAGHAQPGIPAGWQTSRMHA